LPKPLFLRRPSGLYARFLVPVDLRAQVGSRFLVRALPGLRGDAARLVAARLGLALSEAFDLLRRGRTVDIYETLKAMQSTAIRELTFERERLADGTVRERWQVDSDDDARRLKAIIQSDSPRIEDIGMFPPHLLAEANAPRLAERIETYLGDMRLAERSQGNLDDTTYTLHLFLELTGDKPLHRLTTDDVRAFLKAMEVYPSNASKKKVFRGMTPKEILAKAQCEDHPRLSMRTKDKHKDRLAAFLNAQVAEGLADQVAAQGHHQPRQVQDRRAQPGAVFPGRTGGAVRPRGVFEVGGEVSASLVGHHPGGGHRGAPERDRPALCRRRAPGGRALRHPHPGRGAKTSG
jgi:hypothetical protein